MVYRARLFFVLALALALAIVATEFPIGELMHVRSAGAAAASELAKVRKENRLLAGQVKDLKTAGTIEQIAHQQYGLVKAGQRSYVVMPSAPAGSTKAVGPLADDRIPRADLVPTDSVLSPPVSSSSSSGGSFWHRLLRRLEFWKASD